MNDKMTVLVVSCDKYQDIVEQYLRYLRLNWSDCSFPIAVATEECTISDKNVRTIKCGKDVQWTKEVLMALDQIKSEYVLLTVDDLFISKKVDNNALEEALLFMCEHNIDYYRIPKFQVKNSKKSLYSGTTHVARIQKDKVYSITIGSSIWRKTKLKKILGDGTKTAWELEDRFIELALKSKRGYYNKYVTDTRPLLHCAHMVTGGRWIRKGVNDMRKQGYEIDTSKREFLSLGQEMRMKVYGTATKFVPKSFRRPLKSFLKRFGMQFATKN